MRIFVSFKQTVTMATERPNKHAIQGMIYTLLKGTNYATVHDKNHVKQFTFSDWFKKKDGGRYLIISSPDDDFIRSIAGILEKNVGKLKFLDYVLNGVELVNTKSTRFLRSASPVVLVRDGKRNEYHSFKKRTLTLKEFDDLIKNSLVRRYRIHSGNPDFSIKGPLFDAFDFRKEVPVRVDIRGREFLVIGSTWNKLILARNKSREEFYKWIMDVGIGQKNSLGFGCVQPYPWEPSKNKRNDLTEKWEIYV